MIVNIEFFDEDPIENIITSLNYQVDKTIYFGYEEVFARYEKNVEYFLKKKAGVKEVVFYPISKDSLRKILENLEECLKKEIEQGHRLYFDLTGGEPLPLVAFGALSREMKASVHYFNVDSGEMKECRNGADTLLSETAKKRKIKLSVDDYISLHGGVIDYGRQKDLKSLHSEAEIEEIKLFWKLSRKYASKWPYYSLVLRGLKPEEGTLRVCCDERDLVYELKKTPQAGQKEEVLKFFQTCYEKGFFSDYWKRETYFGFTYKNEAVKSYFWDSGSILELYVYTMLLEKYKDADIRVGVHIDWDGVLHDGAGQDVLNEVDIFLLANNQPVFMSCKNGNVNQMALYELETVANRFGGRFAKKIMAVSKKMGPSHKKRAEEMGIEVWQVT